MASTIAAPVPQSRFENRPTPKDVANLPLQEDGRATPLPQYEKTQTVPFNLTLQEDKRHPGQFQLVVNIDRENKATDVGSPKPTPSRKLYDNLQAFPSLGYDVSLPYQTQKSSPPSSPQQEKGWSDLDAIPPDFLKKVVPDWDVTFQKKNSTASTQSKKLADIKARIKRSGKGFVVRLLKGSSAESHEVAEVTLGQQDVDSSLATVSELDACPQAQAELDGVEKPLFEIGTSNEPGIPRSVAETSITPTVTSSHWLNQLILDAGTISLSEEGFSDAETLRQDVRSIGETLDDDSTDLEPMSTFSSELPTRATSIVRTPTRGLSIVGPVKRINKSDRMRQKGSKGKSARLDLNRSDARKYFNHRSPVGSTSGPTIKHSVPIAEATQDTIEQRPRREHRTYTEPSDHATNTVGAWTSSVQNLSSAENTQQGLDFRPKRKSRLSLETDVGRAKSANSSPVTKGKRNLHLFRPRSSTSSANQSPIESHPGISPAWSQVDASDELREALERAFGSVEEDTISTLPKSLRHLSKVDEPITGDHIGAIPLPASAEIRSALPAPKNPTLTFWKLAAGVLAEKLLDALQVLRQSLGPESAVPANHVRVRWTCSCGEPLYDDFVERRPGAARLLEAYLNRPRAHAPTSPAGRTSTASSMSSVFSSASKASTLATPSSTYGGSSSWNRGDSSKYSPTRTRGNPFSVRIGSFTEEQWLLTCANEGRFTPKIVHLDVNMGRIKSDKDLALTIREHYEQLNRKWLKWIRLRGLATIEFVQFEVHRNRFADIRAGPSMPPVSSSYRPSSSTSSSSIHDAQAPSVHPYSFEPIDLLPPVGPTYLLHLFKHPSDYDGELITYLRSPKRRERLETGMGWGINLVEGFLTQKVWTFVMLTFGLGSAVFAVVWAVQKGDVQGAFGVAAWVIGIAGMVVGGLQGFLE